MPGTGSIQSTPRAATQGSAVAPKEFPVMLTLRDCLELSELSEDEVHLIAEHEHIPEIVAAELGNELLHSADGVTTIKAYILDCVEHARRTGEFARADALYAIYRRFDAAHPTSASH
jgi:hypothetical protein